MNETNIPSVSVEILKYDLHDTVLHFVAKSHLSPAYDRLIVDLNAFRDWDEAISDFADSVWGLWAARAGDPTRGPHTTPDWIIHHILGQSREFALIRLECVRARRNYKIDGVCKDETP